MPGKSLPRKQTEQSRIAALLIWACLYLCASVSAAAQNSPPLTEKQQVLWEKLEKSILDVDRNLDGVMGVAIVDLTDGHKYLLHAKDLFPQASSIKISKLEFSLLRLAIEFGENAYLDGARLRKQVLCM